MTRNPMMTGVSTMPFVMTPAVGFDRRGATADDLEI
jgi:hypothetical protein